MPVATVLLEHFGGTPGSHSFGLVCHIHGMADLKGTATSLVFPFADRDGHGFPLLGLMDFDRLIVVD